MLLRSTFIGLFVLSLGCDCSSSSPASDAATDGPNDAAPDAARDAEPDVASDVAGDAPSDTSDDVGDGMVDAGPDDPGWVPLPDFPAGCVIERATHPERLLRNEWGDCGPGCEYLVRDDRFDRGVNPFGWHDGERGYFVINQGLWSEPERERRRILVLAATDGSVLGAWRGPSLFAETQCVPGEIYVGDGYGLLHVVLTTETARQTRLYYAPLEELGEMELPAVVLGADVVPPGAVIQRGSLSRHVFAAELQPAGDLLLVRPDGTVDRQVVAGNPQVPHVVGEDVFVEAWDGPTGHTVLLRARFGEGNAPFIADGESHIAGTFPTSENLSWYVATVPGRISTADRIELWTSPFTNDPAALEPRFVLPIAPNILAGYSRGFQGEGLYATYRPARLVRLSDGVVLQHPSGSGRTDDDVVGGREAYLWIAGGEIGTSAILEGAHGTVRRDAISALVPTE